MAKWTFEPGHTSAEFCARHMMVTYVRGHFKDVHGSLNFDPRSAALNTEMGLVIRSPTLAGRLAKAFDDRIPGEAYEVQLTPKGELQWTERQPQGNVVYHTEPGTSAWRRFCVDVISWLPIDWLL